MRHARQLRTMVLLFIAVSSQLLSGAEIPRPEHPRPDMQREQWLSLNGEWQFEIDSAVDGIARGLTSGKDLNSKIIVPFCPESKLSGLGLGNTQYFKQVWYRRLIEIPEGMKGKRVLLHFGGADYKTWVYVNGYPVGEHIGGSAAFGFDISNALKAGPNEVVVRAFDDLRSGLQPGGKQAYTKSEGCVYTRTTGIWQTVWLEAVGSTYVENVSMVADPDHSRVLIQASIIGLDQNLKLVAEAFADGKLVGSESSVVQGRDQRLVINLSEKKLWSIATPFLYDLKFTVYRGAEKVDELKSYFGLRKVTIDGRRILINDQPVFQRLILDQGYYPDGVWTAPSDAALKHDIELSMAAGFNGARLHEKVFEPRYLYWADKLGYLVWGEFPNWGYGYKPDGYAPYVTEWTEVLLRDRNHPALIGWCPFNESNVTAGEIQQVIWNVTKAVDPTRPALETSGWTHTLQHPDARDAHDYEANAATFRKRWMDYFTKNSLPSLPARYGSNSDSMADCGVPFMVSEFGGIGWATDGGWGYGGAPKTLEEFYARYQGSLDALLDNPNMFGFCYTQLTDVEQEHNGLYYYDRTPKFDALRLRAITARQAAYERNEPAAPQPVRGAEKNWRVLVGSQFDGALCTPWNYVTVTPQGEWMAADFDAKSWQTGLAPFGRDAHWPTRTAWTTDDIYLRKTFDYDGAEMKTGAIVISYDEDTEVYINGTKVLSVQKYIVHYEMHVVTEALRAALHKGTNTIAVHTHQKTGGQHIDLALIVE